MSLGFRGVCVLVVGLSLVTQEARAQMYYPQGYGGYGWGGGFGGGSIANNPAAGFMAGLGSFARDKGVYEIEDAQAQAINQETMLKWNTALRRRQKELHIENQKEDAGRAAKRNARLAQEELADGTTLNSLIYQILDFDPAASKASLSKAPIGGAALREIPFEWNTEAISLCIDQMTGKGALPGILMDPKFAGERDALGTAVDAAIKEDAKGDVSRATTKKVSNAIAKFRAKFVKEVPGTSLSYADGDAYLTTLASLTRLLNDPSMKKALVILANEQNATVGDLIRFIQVYNLRFGPAATERQVRIYESLAAKLKDVLKAMNTAPAPAVTENAGDLPGAAKGAFKGMKWEQLEAHAKE